MTKVIAKVIDRYCRDSGKYIDEEHEVEVRGVKVLYKNSKGEDMQIEISADDFFEQFELVRK